MSESAAPNRLLAARLRLARAALAWELVWPALWPALALIGALAVLALSDLLPALPGPAHAAVLAAFAAAIAAALAWGAWRIAWPARDAARRRIETSSGLAHRPLLALGDSPSAPLDRDGGALWAAHQRQVAAAMRGLRVGWPRSALARRDPWGIRSILAILLLIAMIDAGPDWRDRVARAFHPNFAPGAATVATSFDVWVTPPDYTGLPPQFLKAGDDKNPVTVATGSTLLAQVHGGAAVPKLAIDKDAREFETVDKQNFRAGATLTAGTRLTLSQGNETLGSWPIQIVPDNPPAIDFAHPPSATPRAALRLDFHATDDYGVESVKAVIRRPDDAAAGTIELPLPLPGLHLKEAEATSYHDLSPHPWAGLPVEVRLLATDAHGQTGTSPPFKMTLPTRHFTNPIARALIDERRELVKDPTARIPVAEILGDLNARPALYRNDTLVTLSLSFAEHLLRRDDTAAGTASVVDLLWDTALHIEDGNMSLAERELRRLEQKLQDALARNAPDAEIDQLMRELRQALDNYMQALAQDMLRHPDRAQPQQGEPSRMLTDKDLRDMLDRARDLARGGQREQARQMLSQLQNMLENLRAARPGENRRGSSQTQQTMRGLEELMQKQQQLLDRSFRAQRRRTQQMPPQFGQPGNPDQGQNGEMGDEAGQQENLRRQLGEMMRRLGEGNGDIPQTMGRAERSMHDATGALEQGLPGEAIAPQTEALDQLQQGARDYARQLEEQLGKGMSGMPGEKNPGERGFEGEDSDPFGRPLSSNGTYDQGDVRIPDFNVLQKTRQILDELRRRAGERTRPSIELDYIDRLLKRF
ncbi:MAG TPA: TIGR02302 family protein [Stellaceae bacterium]|nr:TIGR02302 family protein [Stellaceae bacterium]